MNGARTRKKSARGQSIRHTKPTLQVQKWGQIVALGGGVVKLPRLPLVTGGGGGGGGHDVRFGSYQHDPDLTPDSLSSTSSSTECCLELTARQWLSHVSVEKRGGGGGMGGRGQPGAAISSGQLIGLPPRLPHHGLRCPLPTAQARPVHCSSGPSVRRSDPGGRALLGTVPTAMPFWVSGLGLWVLGDLGQAYVPVQRSIHGHGGGGGGRDALEGEGPQRRPQRPLGRRLEDVAEAVGGRLLSVTNAIEAGTWRQGGSGWG